MKTLLLILSPLLIFAKINTINDTFFDAKNLIILDKKTNKYINGVKRYCGKFNPKEKSIRQKYYEIAKSRFRNGQQEGFIKQYYMTGVLQLEISYKDSKAEGIEKIYYENGTLLAEIPFKGGKKEGIEKGYYKSGELQYETLYQKGKKEGAIKGYYKSGKLSDKTIMKNNKAIQGTIYKIDGSKLRNMTHTDFHNMGLKYYRHKPKLSCLSTHSC